MSKKDKKIKSLKREVKELKAELRKLKLASGRRRRTKMASRSVQPATKPPAPPPRTDIDTPVEMAMALKSISAVRSAGQR